ncbi:uncharacterized protein BJ171DRAFT_475367 [Polychytrium aggregatum]|uniref:uncharacterized protein n=1 Tax=Polychytrium aggregatum TaxID=110093 RepID=UPI0022FE00E8|nr:uncharacterized protein BJ171DRAFT_475367 [Polychytrium aggregatum]KAI9204028.1 hypothetical protein BJ171DRAFT_475367 [Polychytrium aggregatum]
MKDKPASSASPAPSAPQPPASPSGCARKSNQALAAPESSGSTGSLQLTSPYSVVQEILAQTPTQEPLPELSSATRSPGTSPHQQRKQPSLTLDTKSNRASGSSNTNLAHPNLTGPTSAPPGAAPAMQNRFPLPPSAPGPQPMSRQGPAPGTVSSTKSSVASNQQRLPNTGITSQGRLSPFSSLGTGSVSAPNPSVSSRVYGATNLLQAQYQHSFRSTLMMATEADERRRLIRRRSALNIVVMLILSLVALVAQITVRVMMINNDNQLGLKDMIWSQQVLVQSALSQALAIALGLNSTAIYPTADYQRQMNQSVSALNGTLLQWSSSYVVMVEFIQLKTGNTTVNSLQSTFALGYQSLQNTTAGCQSLMALVLPQTNSTTNLTAIVYNHSYNNTPFSTIDSRIYTSVATIQSGAANFSAQIGAIDATLGISIQSNTSELETVQTAFMAVCAALFLFSVVYFLIPRISLLFSGELDEEAEPAVSESASSSDKPKVERGMSELTTAYRVDDRLGSIANAYYHGQNPSLVANQPGDA